MVLEEQADHLEEVLQEDAVPIVEPIGKEGLRNMEKRRKMRSMGGCGSICSITATMSCIPCQYATSYLAQ